MDTCIELDQGYNKDAPFGHTQHNPAWLLLQQLFCMVTDIRLSQKLLVESITPFIRIISPSTSSGCDYVNVETDDRKPIGIYRSISDSGTFGIEEHLSDFRNSFFYSKIEKSLPNKSENPVKSERVPTLISFFNGLDESTSINTTIKDTKEKPFHKGDTRNNQMVDKKAENPIKDVDSPIGIEDEKTIVNKSTKASHVDSTRHIPEDKIISSENKVPKFNQVDILSPSVPIPKYDCPRITYSFIDSKNEPSTNKDSRMDPEGAEFDVGDQVEDGSYNKVDATDHYLDNSMIDKFPPDAPDKNNKEQKHTNIRHDADPNIEELLNTCVHACDTCTLIYENQLNEDNEPETTRKSHVANDLMYNDMLKLERTLINTCGGKACWEYLGENLVEKYSDQLVITDIEACKYPGSRHIGHSFMTHLRTAFPDLTVKSFCETANAHQRKDISHILEPFDGMLLDDIPTKIRNRLEHVCGISQFTHREGNWKAIAEELDVESDTIKMIEQASTEAQGRSSCDELFDLLKTRLPRLTLREVLRTLRKLHINDSADSLEEIIADKDSEFEYKDRVSFSRNNSCQQTDDNEVLIYCLI